MIKATYDIIIISKLSFHHLLGLMVPELLLGFALDLRHDELDLLGDQLALLPRHWLASISACPHLGKDGYRPY